MSHLYCEKCLKSLHCEIPPYVFKQYWVICKQCGGIKNEEPIRGLAGNDGGVPDNRTKKLQGSSDGDFTPRDPTVSY